MTTRRILLMTALFLTVSASADEPARAIMEHQRLRHRAPLEQARFQMVLMDKKGRERERSLTLTSRTEESGLERIRLQFQAPADIRKVALLTWEQDAGQEDDQWLYLPARRASKRISSSGKKNSFMGTDLAFEDLRPENTAAYRYAIVREEALDGQTCWVIEAIPATEKESKDSGYAKRLLWIRQDLSFTVQIHYFDRRGNHVKTLVNRDLVEIGEGLWRSNHSQTTTLRRGTSTIMRTIERSLSPQLPRSHFEPDALSRGD